MIVQVNFWNSLWVLMGSNQTLKAAVQEVVMLKSLYGVTSSDFVSEVATAFCSFVIGV